VLALIEAVRGRFDIPQRWYRLKAKLLGVDGLADYDRSAPVLAEEVTFSFAEARELVLDTYESFAPAAGRLVRRFFDERWIDAPPRPNKRGGAFCSYTVPSVHPYVLLNFTARRRDVLTMAHELGHGLHAALAQPQGVFHQATPLTLAETASVFGETIVFGRLLERAESPESDYHLVCRKSDANNRSLPIAERSCVQVHGLCYEAGSARRLCCHGLDCRQTLVNHFIFAW